MNANRKEATPIEIAALLMDAVCTPEEKEQAALRQLAGHLGIDLERMQTELMFLRAFTVDFAVGVTLGQGPERQGILDQYYRHWERIDREVGQRVLEDLQDRLQLYVDAVDGAGRDPSGLQELLGRTFARCCRAEKVEGDLTLLGSTMFGVLFSEIADLLQEVEVVPYGMEEGEE